MSAALLHHGEEPVLSGSGPGARGSGTIFFAGCNLKCLFCQNHQISWGMKGRIVSDGELARLMLGLQDQGALNINLVSPTHLILPILRALLLAYDQGLRLPLVYNSNGYEHVAVVEHLAGIMDIYLPDCKYRLPEPAAMYSGAADYFDHARPALQEMYVQQPDLHVDDDGIARRGTIIRHLVLPGQVPNAIAVLEWLAATFSPALPVSLMSQYRPCFQAPPEIRRPVSPAEYGAVMTRARELGFEHLFLQPELFAPEDHLHPDFDRNEPFPWKGNKS